MLRKIACLVSVCLTALHAELGPELLKNSGFEVGEANGLPAAWTCDDAGLSRHELADFGGNYVVDAKPTAYCIATQNITLVPGKQHTVTARLRSTGSGRGGVLLLHGEKKPTREMPLIWNADTEGQYITLTRTFTAPNPQCRIYTYDLSKTGNVSYDFVSLREGEPDEMIIRQFGLREIDKPLTPPPVTEHIEFASKLAGGPLRTLFFIPTLRVQREINELTERIEMDCDVVGTGNASCTEMASFTGNRANSRLKENFYESFVFSARASAKVQSSVLAKVKAGAGLVFICGNAAPEEWKALTGWKALPKNDPIWQLFPMKSFPDKDLLAGIWTTTYGEGRVFRIVFDKEAASVFSLLPCRRDGQTVWLRRQEAYWENWYALLGELIHRSARGESKTTIQANGRNLTFSPDVKKLQVVFQYKNELRFDGEPTRRSKPAIQEVFNGKAILLPSRDNLSGYAVLSALDENDKTLAWKVIEFGNVSPLLAFDNPATEVCQPNASPTVCFRPTAKCNLENITLRIRLIDPYKQVLEQKELSLPNITPNMVVKVPIPTSKATTAFNRIEVILLKNGVEMERIWKPLMIPELNKKVFDDFAMLPWRTNNMFPSVMAEFTELSQDLGFNADFPVGASNGIQLAESGMPAAGYVGDMGPFRDTASPADGIRRQCLNDPAVRKLLVETTRNNAEEHKPVGPFAIGITDEAFISSHHKQTEYCFCDICKAKYRQWLQKHYKSLEALNRQWGTAFTSWEEIHPARSDDVRGKANYAPFVDFRTFMTDVWIDVCRLVSDTYRSVQPGVPIGHTNTFGITPFCGNDYWKLATQAGFGWQQEYSEAIKITAHKAIFEIWRSFTPEDYPNYGWLGYNHSKEAADYECWWLAFHRSRGVSYFAINSLDMDRMTSWALSHPTLAHTGFGDAVAASAADLRNGLGKLLMEYKRERPQVALLYSHPSALVAWCESTTDLPEPKEGADADSYGSYFRSAFNFRQHIDNLQLDADYVAKEQILAGDGLKGRKILFLPFTVAFDRALEAPLLKFVEDGGILIADIRALRTDEHGTPFPLDDNQPLLKLFGVKRTPETTVTYKQSTVTIKDLESRIDLQNAKLSCMDWETITAAGAEPWATHANGTPAIFTRNYGKGITCYLNFRLADYDAISLVFLQILTKTVGIAPHVEAKWPVDPNGSAANWPIDLSKGTPFPKAVEVNTFQAGENSVYGIICDFRRMNAPQKMDLLFYKNVHLYEARSRKYYGYASSLSNVELAPGQALVFSALPYTVNGITASFAEKEPGMLSIEAAVQASKKPGKHVLHLAITRPDGTSTRNLSFNMVANDGIGETIIPIGLNRMSGKWTAIITDVLTGVRCTTTWQL
ncbi:MAG: beta-galactosidase [Victivallales bacterium]|nr:beta-galactosidase [Victivallales bacterium]